MDGVNTLIYLMNMSWNLNELYGVFGEYLP